MKYLVSVIRMKYLISMIMKKDLTSDYLDWISNLVMIILNVITPTNMVKLHIMLSCNKWASCLASVSFKCSLQTLTLLFELRDLVCLLRYTAASNCMNIEMNKPSDGSLMILNTTESNVPLMMWYLTMGKIRLFWCGCGISSHMRQEIPTSICFFIIHSITPKREYETTFSYSQPSEKFTKNLDFPTHFSIFLCSRHRKTKSLSDLCIYLLINFSLSRDHMTDQIEIYRNRGVPVFSPSSSVDWPLVFAPCWLQCMSELLLSSSCHGLYNPLFVHLKKSLWPNLMRCHPSI
jgi:hypothetical protein